MPKGFLLNRPSTLNMNVPPNPRKRLLRCALLDFAEVVALEAPLPPSPVSPVSPGLAASDDSPVNLTIPSPPMRVDLPLTPDHFGELPLPLPLSLSLPLPVSSALSYQPTQEPVPATEAAPERVSVSEPVSVPVPVPVSEITRVESSPPKKLCTTKFTCKLCSLNFSDPFSLARHVCAAIRPVEYRCPECDKVFNNPANLASHRRWHKPSAQQQLHCPHCSMLFRRNSLLKKHVEAEHSQLHHLHLHKHLHPAAGESQTSGRLHSNAHFISHIQGLAHHPESPFIPVPSLH